MLQPGVRAGPLRWESQLQDTGPQETYQLHVISNGEISQRSPSQCQDPAPLNDQQATVLDTLCQTTSKTGTQPHPLAERLPNFKIRPQTPKTHHQTWTWPPERQDPASSTRIQAVVPPNRKPIQPTEPTLANGDRQQKKPEATNLQPLKRRPQTQ